MTALLPAPATGADLISDGNARFAGPKDLSKGRRGGKNLRVLDLFAGAGGLTEGFRQAGRFDSVAAVELDPAAATTFSLNHPESEVFVGPIQEWLEHEHGVPEVDVIVGGPPCQGFSTLGKRNAEDERNDLWRQYALTIVRARPSWFAMENVGTFLRSPQYQQLQAETEPGGILADYAVEGRVLNAADFGAAQSRRRAVVIGHRKDLPFPGWPEPTHADRPVTVRERLQGVRPHVSQVDLPQLSHAVLPTDRVTIAPSVRMPTALGGAYSTRELHVGRDYSELSLARFASIPSGGNRFDIPDEILANCWRKHHTGSADVMGRLRWERPSVTIRTEFFKPEKGRYLHPDEDRAITHYEAALLQGFPEDYRWVGSKVAIARQIGNAVPIPLARAIAAQISRQHE